ncbi:MAG: methylmalonyl-CoA mutase subunit beta [Candidatus Cloacimonetes bacterium]|nr:methylmalonyl-CoA mutase subunit beta [Candidatus Cloacimonadota bacterium]
MDEVRIKGMPLAPEKDFPYPTEQDWREAVDKLLKGKPYDRIMLKSTYEGITLEGIYHNTANLPHMGGFPGFAPYVRGTEAGGYHTREWEVAQNFRHGLPADVNKEILSALNRGQNCVYVTLDTESSCCEGVRICCDDDLKLLMDSIDVEAVAVRFDAGFSTPAFTALLGNCFPDKKLHGSLMYDPLALLTATGNAPGSMKKLMDTTAENLQWLKYHQPGLRLFTMQGSVWHNGGANAVQELALTFTTGIYYIREMLERGHDIKTIAASIEAGFSAGSQFFMEIAKLRAARVMWASIIEAFGGGEEAQKLKIHINTSSFNKTAVDPWVNMLRNTTETFSAIAGMADSIEVSPFDAPIRHADAFSMRQSRNVHLVLKEESHFSQVIDPAAGSYFVEAMTSELIRRGWETLQLIEAEGGIIPILQSGKPQREISEILVARRKNFFRRKDVFVGVNMYANTTEKPLEENCNCVCGEKLIKCNQCNCHKKTFTLDTSHKFDSMLEAMGQGIAISDLMEELYKGSKNDLSIEPIAPTRLTKPWEELRYKVDAKKLNVLLVPLGSVEKYRARADFSRGFFESAGFVVSEAPAFSDMDEAAKYLSSQSCDIAVICSADDLYPEYVSPLFAKLGQTKAKYVLAGYPKEHIETLKEAGIDEFIYIKADAYQILNSLAKQCGVEL